ncbi:DUF2924 domain-containing protein [Euryhalocaulis caribicus]|uniref:DUF2924 domain-containing protein n=1 Tax=Euryhalocaulis caribicus TaxID=1161401 RepID=UPI00039AD91D|nr:DUF2924 domain-containing protein [Euryhalocaulis caribicus]
MANQESIAERLAELESLDRDRLCELWSREMDAPLPHRLSRTWMIRFIADALEAKAYGALPLRVQKRLAAAAKMHCRSTPRLKPGARLVREWNGIVYTVDVREAGFEWRGERYRSLSAVARAITGARWSGPRFFGLTDRSGRA